MQEIWLSPKSERDQLVPSSVYLGREKNDKEFGQPP